MDVHKLPEQGMWRYSWFADGVRVNLLDVYGETLQHANLQFLTLLIGYLPEKESPENNACSQCKKVKPDVTMREDPYAAEIEGDHTLILLCDECEHENAMDI